MGDIAWIYWHSRKINYIIFQVHQYPCNVTHYKLYTTDILEQKNIYHGYF